MDSRRPPPTGMPAWPGVVHMVMNPVPPPYGYGPPPGAPPPSMWPAAAPMQYGAPPPLPHQQHWPPPLAYHHGANGQLHQLQFNPPPHHHHPGAYSSPRFNQQQQQWVHPNRSPSMPRVVDPMEHNEHKCEPCQRTFAGKAQYTAHLATHTKCGRQGCTFEASGKMLKEHQQSAHMSPAVAAKWKQVWEENRDEIQRWRAERKRSFPTRDNIERKRKQAVERTATGAIDVDAVDRCKRLREILAQQRRLGLPVAEIAPHLLRDPVRRARLHNPRSQQHGHPNKTRPTPLQTATAVEAREQDASGASPMASVVVHAPMQGTAQLAGDMAHRDLQQIPEGAAVISDNAHLDEPDAKRQQIDSNGKADMPATSEAELMERPAQLADGTTGPASTTAPRRRKPCYYFAQGRCRKGNNCTFAHDSASNQQHTMSKSVEKGPARNNNRQPNPTQRKRDPTLLEKLLAREIRLENSRLLQAFRFLVLNNFFVEDKPLVFPQTLAEAEADARTAELAELRKLVQEAERDGNMIDLSDGEEDVPKEGVCVPSLFEQPRGARCGVESGNGADQQAHVGVVHCLDGRTSLVD